MPPRTVRRPAGQAGRQEAVEDSGTTVDAAEDGPALGTKYLTRCPVCGDSTADATWKMLNDGPGWIVGCFSASCKALGGYWIEEAGQVFGLGERATKEQVAAAIRREAAGRSCRRSVAEPWSDGLQAGWAHRVQASEPEALRYLVDERGLTPDAIQREQIGYAATGTGTPPWPDLGAFVFPCHKKRFWPKVPTDAKGKPVKCVALPGSAASLDVKPPPGRALIVAEGEFDAVLRRETRGGC